ncbi:hypothetical protein SAMN05216207_104710 [Pseudonocardia ammonioxydans]|uniref:Uncharacterized protein n=1 Tax=Pseudonocardia ammonioxydans TaxID=260086 RepID=A0A1I5GJN5_PSUAM|nr:Rv3235 family protein [Pseudonocardia ammonioxydans]SFO35801.1 hypothetical protein SAMN05216207_104710 [Pseudonocardia ammonioxydans]
MSSERVTQAERSNYTLARTFVSELPSGPITVRLMQRLDPLADDRIGVAEAETCQHCGGDLRLPPEVTILGTPPEHHIEPDEPPTEDVHLDPQLPRIARHAMEIAVQVLAAERPATHLMRVAEGSVARYLQVLSQRLRDGRARRATARLLSCHVSQPHEGAAELAGTVKVSGGAVLAFAARMELHKTGWRMEQIRVPEPTRGVAQRALSSSRERCKI